MKKMVWIITGILMVAAIAAFFLFKAGRNEENALKTAKVAKGDISRSISATGRLNPIRSVAVGSQVSGTIKRIYVDYNSAVKRGEVIVQLDPALFEAQVQQAGANLIASEAKLKQAMANLRREEVLIESDIAQKTATLKEKESDFNRNHELYEKGMVSRQDMDRAGEAYEVAKAQLDAAMAGRSQIDVRREEVESARASVSQMKAALRLAETNLGYATIRSPMDGIVIARSVDEGQTVAASLSAPTLVTIGDMGMMEVKVSVDEADIGQVNVGQTAAFTVDSFPGKTFQGKVSKIYLAPIIQQNVVTYEVVVEIDNKDRLLMPGMTANASILTSEKKDVLLLPNSSLRVKMPEKPAGALGEGKKRVWVREGRETVAREVVTGISDNRNTEVMSGLLEGEEVVIEVSAKEEKRKRASSPLRMSH